MSPVKKASGERNVHGSQRVCYNRYSFTAYFRRGLVLPLLPYQLYGEAHGAHGEHAARHQDGAGVDE